mmetsp:Transcript_81482/g.174552  ORF Transcript_81482/g.174552 Transcript_81482/m.174552 type:complete len:277 (+) Transcript_81482:68-898(+)
MPEARRKGSVSSRVAQVRAHWQEKLRQKFEEKCDHLEDKGINLNAFKDDKRKQIDFDELHEDSVDFLPVCNSIDSTHLSVSVGGVPRPILSEVEEDRLNTLVREVRHSDLTVKQRMADRADVVKDITRDVEDLHRQRHRFSWQVPGWRQDSWRSMNIQKRRSKQADGLHDVVPDQRRRVLHSIADASAASGAWVETPDPMELLMKEGQRLRRLLDVQKRNSAAAVSAVAARPGSMEGSQQAAPDAASSRLSATEGADLRLPRLPNGRARHSVHQPS